MDAPVNENMEDFMKTTIALAALVATMAACGDSNDKKPVAKVTPSLTGIEEAEPVSKVEPNNKTKNRISAKVFALNGTYFSEAFHGLSPAVSRSLEIRGNSFVSTVAGLAPGTMSVIAVQTESGLVVENEDGTVSLQIEASTCAGVPEFVSATALEAKWSDLEITDGVLNFTYEPFGLPRKGTLQKVEDLTEPTAGENSIIEDACWYIGANGSIRAGIVKHL
jgi:hypothetical protein